MDRSAVEALHVVADETRLRVLAALMAVWSAQATPPADGDGDDPGEAGPS
jgi:hypothetical protein